MGQAVTGWLTDEHCILRSAESRAEQSRVGPRCRLHGSNAMQAALPPPFLRHHHHPHHHHHCSTTTTSIEMQADTPSIQLSERRASGWVQLPRLLAGPCPLTPALGVAHPVPMPVPPTKNGTTFLSREMRDYRSCISAPAIMLGNRDTIDSTAISPAHCPGSQIGPWARWHAVRP